MTGVPATELAVGLGGAADRELILIAFMAFIGLSLMMCVLAGPEGDEAADFYTGNRSLSPVMSALALAGDWISAATLLGTCGMVALAGYDGISLAVCSCLAVGGFLLLAGPLRNVGGYSLGDILAARTPGPAARMAAAAATLAVCVPFLVVQLSSVGTATAMLLGMPNPGARQVCTVFIGVAMICYTVLGGMRGTSLIQIVKMAVVLTTMAVLAAAVLSHFHWSLGTLFTSAQQGSGSPGRYYKPGQVMGTSFGDRLDFLGLQLSIVLGGACMPQMVMRIGTTADVPAARRAARYTVIIMAVFSVLVVIAGLGAAGIVGDRALRAVDGSGQMALMLVAGGLEGGTSSASGTLLFTAVACTIFVSLLAVVAGITLTAAAALAHDAHAHVRRRGGLSEQEKVRSARWAVLGVGAVGIGVAVGIQSRNLESLVHLSLTAAAATVLPACLYSLFCKRYNRVGLLWTVYGGLLCVFTLFVVSAAFSGTPGSLMPRLDVHLIELKSTGLIAIPAGFVLGWMGTALGRRGKPTDRESELIAREAHILAEA
ncbi:cation acetate symporter [Streptomyces sp. SID5914]|nr:cation acetate symporter [Streptomyces sp. SID5914]MZG18661.1 cation acetate symporter [Streptomyces sp. SID5914]